MTMTHEAENIELAALRAMHETTPPAGRAALGLALHELDGVTMSVATRDLSILINRAIGLGLGLLSSARITIRGPSGGFRLRGSVSVARRYNPWLDAASPIACRERLGRLLWFCHRKGSVTTTAPAPSSLRQKRAPTASNVMEKPKGNGLLVTATAGDTARTVAE